MMEVKRIDKKTTLNVLLDCVYEFESAKQCRAAESSCKETLPCSVLSRDDMPDGFTETTFAENYHEIIKIYENFGGKPVDTASRRC